MTALPKRLTDAHTFEDKVVDHLNTYNPDIHATLYGQRTEKNTQLMHNDLDGFLVTRAKPDIQLNISGINCFVEAKTYNKNKPFTGNHLVDEHSEIGMIAHKLYTQRDHVFAFDHPDGTIGFMTLESYLDKRGPLRATEAWRNSECGYHLVACDCISGEDMLVHLIERWEARHKAAA